MASNLLVTGKWGEVHVTSAQQRNFNSGVVGDGQYVMNGLTATMSDSNTLHMDPGVACMNGADVEVPAGGVDVTVTNGTQGMLRNDLICMRYTMDGPTQKESVELVCVRGTPAAADPQDPEYNDGSILDGSPVVDMPLYRVPLDGISVGDPEPLFDVLMPMADLWDSVSHALYSGPGAASVALSEDAEGYDWLDVEVASAQGNRKAVRLRPGATADYVSHGITGGTCWVSFGTLAASGRTARITSQVNMPITAYEWGEGTGNTDCRIVSVIGVRAHPRARAEFRIP